MDSKKKYKHTSLMDRIFCSWNKVCSIKPIEVVMPMKIKKLLKSTGKKQRIKTECKSDKEMERGRVF